MSDAELELLAQSYKEGAAAIRALEEQQEALKARMVAELDFRKAEMVGVGLYVIRWGMYERRSIDTAALKADRPEIVEAYTRTAIIPRFQVT